MASSKSIITENFKSGRSDMIYLLEGHYILEFPRKELLNNVLTRIRVLKGIATVYQRDTIKRSGERSFVPIEVGYIVPDGYGGRAQFEEDMKSAIRKSKGVISIRHRNPTKK